MDNGTKTNRLITEIRFIASHLDDFDETRGAGNGDHFSNAFVQLIKEKATEVFSADFSEQSICGGNNLRVDYYFPDERCIVEIALSIGNPTSEFERDIFKALLAKERHPVDSLLFVTKKTFIRRMKNPSVQSICQWVKKHHQLSISVVIIDGDLTKPTRYYVLN